MTRPTLAGLEPGPRLAEWDADGAQPPVAVVCDVDGTLLEGPPPPTDAVLSALTEAVAAGLRVGVATGRQWQGTDKLVSEWGLTGPHVLHNGAEVRYGDDTRRWPLPTRLVRPVLDLAAAHDWYVEAALPERFLATDDRPEGRAHWRLLNAEPSGGLDALYEDDEVVKLTLVVPEGQTGLARDRVIAFGAEAVTGYAPSTPTVRYVNVTRSGADKGHALTVAAALVGAGPGGLAVIGDGENDLSMLAVAGTAIAMAAAPGAVRAQAHLLAPPVGEDGAATAVRALTAWFRSTTDARSRKA